MTAAEKKPLSLACVSVMWGLLPLPEDRVDDWLDSAAAGYEGISTFDRDLLRLLAERDLESRHDLCTEVGAGLCDWDAVFGLLKKRRYEGWIAVEQNGPMGERRESAAASARFIRAGLDL
jgi:sugar phosphate isomerase/epimerase